MQMVLHGGSSMHSKESHSLSDIKPVPSLFSILYPAGQPIRTLHSKLAVALCLLSLSKFAVHKLGIGMISSGARDSLVQLLVS